MRRVLFVAWLAGCGRIGFDPTALSDANGDSPAQRTGFSRLIAYADQTCGVLDGVAVCWGRNDAGQLGDGTMTNRNVPTSIAVPAGTVTAIAEGESHGCAIVDGAASCWGSGFGPTPAEVSFPRSPTLIDAGRSFTCAVAGDLFCWGTNDSGQLGTGNTSPHDIPTRSASSATMVALDVGDDHACAVTSGGEVLCWGHNDSGTLGTGMASPASVLQPTATLPSIKTIPRIAGWHACNLDAGRIACWGRNIEGELGDGGNADNPVPVASGLPTTTVLATGGGPTDFDASCAATVDGVACWGAGRFGRLGDGDTGDRNIPIVVQGLPDGIEVLELAIGYDHACARLADGDVWCWGRGDSGQLGQGAFANSLVPVRVLQP